MARNSKTDVQGGTLERVDDPVLAGWLYGVDWTASPQGARAGTFTLWKPKTPPPPARAWLVSYGTGRTFSDMVRSAGEPSRVLTALRNAKPLTERASRPECLDIPVEIDGPGVVVIAQLAHPDWTGRWTGPEGERPASIVRVFGGWQGVLLPGNGAWTLHLEYRGEDVWTGLKVSAFAWTVGALAFCLRWWREGRSAAKTATPPPPVELVST